jgi:hypothetical protein
MFSLVGGGVMLSCWLLFYCEFWSFEKAKNQKRKIKSEISEAKFQKQKFNSENSKAKIAHGNVVVVWTLQVGGG